ncbi:YaeQ family protein [Alcaligenes endophyticus]|uniref:YaeQ family protein n=1 Tax=Alcaligenes endophyticus TaxID=1929088 RepID=A0ABT8EM67_9BURK|nr:YaeQ family protein [Alcaligenes endophyticus]MCX5591242.1 YaeQ family protein [Alcaligenes endophyticus]MDN4122180.1 YaeQ family protein [Alcaligenes endophyticus]
MALRATIYKAELHIADNDRSYYASHAVTVARHPSETEERLMVRLLAFALHVNGEGVDQLTFTRGLSEADEPELWRQDLTGAIEQWIDLGLPDERRLLKASGRASEVIVIAYGRSVDIWWQGLRNKMTRVKNIRVYYLPAESTQALAQLCERGMSLSINVQDGQAWISSTKGDVNIEVLRLEP